MKNLFATLLVALTLGTSAATFAAANPIHDKDQTGQASPASVSIVQVEKSKLDVVIENEGNARISIGLLDSSGRSLAFKTFSGKEIDTRLRFDLSKLADGVYQVKVIAGRNTQVSIFELETTVLAAAYQKLTIL
jgi:hypothetical protein